MHFMEAQCMTANLGAKHSLELITRANSFDDRRREFNAVAAKTIRLNEGGFDKISSPPPRKDLALLK